MVAEKDAPLPLVEDYDKGHRFLVYATDSGVRVELQVDEGTFWASQSQMVDAFGVTRQNISLHLQNIFKEGELSEASFRANDSDKQTPSEFRSYGAEG